MAGVRETRWAGGLKTHLTSQSNGAERGLSMAVSSSTLGMFVKHSHRSDYQINLQALQRPARAAVRNQKLRNSPLAGVALKTADFE
jgi:hypothetical protein